MTVTNEEIKKLFDNFLKYWDEVAEMQTITNEVDMKKARYFLEQVIPKFIEKENKK